MYRRIYGTRHHVTPHDFVPSEREPWLQAKSEVPLFLRWFLGAFGVILVLAILGMMDLLPAPPHPLGGILLLILVLAFLAALISLTLLGLALLCRDPHQYCPDCLSYMTRGANACPFCGFRPEPVRNAWQS
jgi:hypothetical protein